MTVVIYCYQKYADKQSIALNILTQHALRGLGTICTFRWNELDYNYWFDLV